MLLNTDFLSASASIVIDYTDKGDCKRGSECFECGAGKNCRGLERSANSLLALARPIRLHGEEGEGGAAAAAAAAAVQRSTAFSLHGIDSFL